MILRRCSAHFSHQIFECQTIHFVFTYFIVLYRSETTDCDLCCVYVHFSQSHIPIYFTANSWCNFEWEQESIDKIAQFYDCFFFYTCSHLRCKQWHECRHKIGQFRYIIVCNHLLVVYRISCAQNVVGQCVFFFLILQLRASHSSGILIHHFHLVWWAFSEYSNLKMRWSDSNETGIVDKRSSEEVFWLIIVRWCSMTNEMWNRLKETI